jgi:hypothetical protein
MCFSASTGLDGSAINGLILLVESFTVPFDHFVLILFLQKEANYKRDYIDNSKDATKVCQELTSRAFAIGVHNLSGFKWSLPLWPLFHSFISGGHLPHSLSYGYELITKRNYECILVTIFLTIRLDICMFPLGPYVCPNPPLSSLSRAFIDLAMNSSLAYILERAR